MIAGIEFDLANGRFVEGDLADINLRRFGGLGLGFGFCRLLLHRFEDGVEVAGAVGVLHQHQGRSVQGQFIDMDIALDDVQEAITSAHFGNAHQGFGSGGLNLQIGKDHFAKGMDGGVAHRDVGVQSRADFGQNDAFEESGAGPDEIGGDNEYEENAENPGDYS